MTRGGRSLVLMLLLVGGAISTFASPKLASKEEALQAIATFQKDPSSREGLTAAATFTDFARKSDAVQISLSKAVVPWMKGHDEPDADTRNMLLAAYIAGNIHAQLTHDKVQDDPYAGWQQVLLTYEQLQQINPTVKFSEVDDLKSKEKAGTLRAYATELLEKQKNSDRP